MPGSAESLVEYRLSEAGRDVLGVAAHVPHYLARSAVPGRGVGRLEALTAATGLVLPGSRTRCGMRRTPHATRSTGRSPRATRNWSRSYGAGEPVRRAGRRREPAESDRRAGRAAVGGRSRRRSSSVSSPTARTTATDGLAGAAAGHGRSLRHAEVGLTGGIGAGKSEVSRLLASYGAVLVDADRIAREVVEPGTPGLAAVVAEFGDGGAGRRRRPGPARARRDRLRRPGAAARAQRDRPPPGRRPLRRAGAAAGPDAVVVHDVPLLAENGLARCYDVVVVVDAAPRDPARPAGAAARNDRGGRPGPDGGPGDPGASGWRSPTS